MSDLPWTTGDDPATRNGAKGRGKCRRHLWIDWVRPDGSFIETKCRNCSAIHDTAVSRRSRNNGKRGRHAELVVARLIPGGRKVGPLGLPWDVEVGEYARLQVKQLAAKPSANAVRKLIEAIPDTGDRLRGFVWVEAATHGPLGQAKVVWFLYRDFVDWHGIGGAAGFEAPGELVSMPLDSWIAEFIQ